MEKKDLKPAGVFHYFEEICQVPRPSKKEEKIIAYLKAFGEKHKLETKVDEAGNVLIKKPATPGMENRKTVVLQSHVDMVCGDNVLVSHILAVFANGEARYRAYGKHTDERFWTEKFPLQQILDILASHES